MELQINNNANYLNLVKSNNKEKIDKKEVTVCLNMIVKNESKIITRLFDSVLPLIDSFCICDTGSTDDTVNIIQNYFLEKGLSGKIIFEPFLNFEHNRNFALRACLGLSDYVLFLDADMVLQINHFDKNILQFYDNFTIFQGNDSFFYFNMRIIRNCNNYIYQGFTHEYLDLPEFSNTFHIPKELLFILDVGDGGSKQDKFERDIRLLKEEMLIRPNKARTHFYLANSYFDLGKFEEAIPYYLKRIELGEWIQEVWYSHYKIGLCYQKLERMSDAVFTWLEGYNSLPERLENLYEIIKYYRITGKYNLCHLYYEICKNILDKNIERSKYLFLDNDVYTYKIYNEYTIFAYYLNIKNINNEMIKVLNYSRNNVDSILLFNNMKFYINILKSTTQHNFNDNIVVNINGRFVVFQSSSCCIIINPDNKNTYLMNIRYVNYYIAESGDYTNCENHIISINKLVELNELFIPIREKIFDLHIDNRRYMGIEDIRIIYDDNNKLYRFIGNGFHANNMIGVVTGEYNVNFYDNSDNKKLDFQELKQSFIQSDCEKNWVFFPFNKEWKIVYCWYPLTICKIVENELLVELKRNMPFIFSKARGSTCGCKYENEIWFIVHFISFEKPRFYYHMIVVFDDNMNLLRYTAPFKFTFLKIEYCLGFIVEKERIIVSYSTMDRTTHIVTYDKIYIESLLLYR